MNMQMGMAHAIAFGGLALACSATEPDFDTEPEPISDEIPTCLDPDVKRSKVPEFPLTYTTDHLDIYVDEERFMCAGTAVEYERFVSYVSEQLGVEVQRRIPVYFGDFIGEWCSTPSAAACSTQDGTVFAVPRLGYHELVHGVACETRMPAAPMFAEGLAASFEPHENTYKGNPKEFSEKRTEFGYYYDYAGHFVRWLYERLGAETFMDLYAHATFETGIWAAIEAAYGSTLESDYLEQSPAFWVPHRQCADLPLLEPTNDVWSFESRFDCDDVSTMGPYERLYHHFHDDNVYQSFLIEIDEPGNYRVDRADWELVGDTDIYFERCLDEHPVTMEEAKQEWVQRLVWFNFHNVEPDNVGLMEFDHPGLWRIDVVREYGPPVDVWLKIGREPDWISAPL